MPGGNRMGASSADLLQTAPVILGEGAVIERLRREFAVELHPELVNAAFVYDPAGRAAQETIYRQYLAAGERHGLPMLLSTPTWRANRERLARAGLADRDVNGDNFRFLDALRRSYGPYAGQIVISGLLSCRGDAYDPREGQSTEAAREFHRFQAEALAAAGVDLLLASTLPGCAEAAGLAQAMAATGLPYIVSFVIRPTGTLLDGTPLHRAIAVIDGAVEPRPLGYLVNCSHASIFRRAICQPGNDASAVRARLLGLLANTAALSPEELDEHPELVTEPPDDFAAAVAALHAEFGLRLLGGCCGTDGRHIAALAERLATLVSR